jgi:hypothetical protein
LPGNTEAAKSWSAKLKNPKNPIKTEDFYNTLVVPHERDVSTAIFRLQYEIMVHKGKLYKHENKLSPVPKKKSVRIQISWPVASNILTTDCDFDCIEELATFSHLTS